ncbi:Neural-cadherin [Portunus trituberculatus]|uniref:Neural-cadherin n=1 Tax=Portunus trituberculatus TaxID=210409 RepID=A0A5B7D4A3_PORTR|nr:Neural-cadherin [Portunus trituberculatus]
MDLGHGILSQGSAPGCPAAECSESGLKCRGSPGNLRCECQPGWSGQDCNTATSPATFQVNSYVKLALSFTPLTYSTSLQLRHGSVTVLLVDDGDGDLYNASLSMDGRQVLEVDKQEGVHVGGSPEYVGVSVFKIHGDYHEGCVDDIRISGRRMPLPPAVNNTPWGQASLYQRVEQDCDSPPACANVTCRPPLTCVDTWRSHYCGCGEGRKLSSGRGTCEDVNECLWEPCLNGGSCFNKQAVGYVCECPSGFGGDQCHIPDVTHTTLRLSLGALAAVLILTGFHCVPFLAGVVVVVGAVLLHQHHSRSTFRRGEAQMKESAVNGKGTSSPPRRRAPSLLELQLLKPPRANGQPAWNNAHRTGEKALQADSTSAERTDDPEQGGDDAECSRNCRNRQLTFSCSVEDDLRNYAYEGDESSPGSLSSCKWTRRARNGRKVNYEVYRIRSSMEGCGNTVRVASGPHLVESWHPGTQHPRTTASITTLSSDSRHPVSTTTCDIHAADETTSLPMYPDLLSPPTGDVVSVTIPPELLTPPGPAQIPDPPRAFSTQ